MDYNVHMSRIEGSTGPSISTQIPSSQVQGRASAAELATIGEQVQQVLFSRPPPPLVDPAHFPQLAETLNLLRRYKKKLAVMAGDAEDDYDILLSEGTIAMIDRNGRIYVGKEFLAAFRGQPETLVGVLAHEIGHRPKRWDDYRTERALSHAELAALCRYEEVRADDFCGRALAELGMSAEPVAAFLESLTEQDRSPHPKYFPVADRVCIIREGHQASHYRALRRRDHFPDFDRMTSPKRHLGEY
jgi:hypothetical protein